jgi:hypothetical protein
MQDAGRLLLHRPEVVVDRRSLVGLALASLCWVQSSRAAEVAPPSCDVWFDTTDSMGQVERDSISPRSNLADDDFENSLVWVTARIADYFGINFSFGFYTEHTVPNAAWFDDNAVGLKPVRPNEPSDGTILIGRLLARETQSRVRNFGAAMTALLAHESGHALQKKYKLRQLFLDDLETAYVRAELCADFICGYFAAYRQTLQANYPVSIQAITQFRKGDTGWIAFGHGSPHDRAKAVDAGYQFGRSHPNDSKGAILAGVDFSRSLKLENAPQ